MLKLNRYAKSGTDVLENVSIDREKKLIPSAHKAVHSFTMIACIAIGLIQICSLRFHSTISNSPIRWLRTKTNEFPSEASTADILRKSIFHMFCFKSNLPRIQFILDKQVSLFDEQIDIPA